MFSEDELEQARAEPIAERRGAGLRRAGHELVGPCPTCGGVDRFAIELNKNIWNCRGCGVGGDAIDAEMHFNGCSFVDAVKILIGQDAGTANPRPPTAGEIASRKAREAQRQLAEAQDRARNEASAARLLARLQPIWATPGKDYLRDERFIDVNHWAIRRALQSVEAVGWCERVYVKELDPKKPLYPFHGQYLGAIVAILTDPISGERTGGISRTYLHQGKKIDKAKSLGAVGRPGVIRLSPDDEVGDGLHLCEGLESALSWMMMGFVPMWSTGSKDRIAKFPVLDGVETLTVLADNDRKTPDEISAGELAACEACQRWADAGREAIKGTPKRPGEDGNDIIKRRARG